MKKTFLIFISLLLVLVYGCGFSTAFAATDSGVLADLHRDRHFNEADYPAITDRNDERYGTLQVIQLAESTNKEFLLYVYQPSAKLQATSVSMSTTTELQPIVYKLEKIDSSGTLFKYKVKDFAVADDAVRTYTLVTIWRKFDNTIDDGSNLTNEKAYAVGQEWTATTVNGNVSYSMLKVDTIEILNPYVGSLLYRDGYWFGYGEYTDAHYIAFDTDKQMDELLEAEITYVTREYSKDMNFPIFDRLGEPSEPQYLKLTQGQKVEQDKVHLWGTEYKFSRIVKTQDFISKENISDETVEKIKSTKWVIRFLETKVQTITISDVNVYGTLVSEVSILRLKFQTAGRVYNLGAVMNKVASDTPDWANGDNGLPRWLKILIIVVVSVIVLWVIVKLLKIIFKKKK